MVTQPRKKDGKELTGHVPLQKRILSQDPELLKRKPQYSPCLGDDIKLYMSLLLALMPLHRIKLVWSDKEKAWRLPTSAFPMKFHRSYAEEIAETFTGAC